MGQGESFDKSGFELLSGIRCARIKTEKVYKIIPTSLVLF